MSHVYFKAAGEETAPSAALEVLLTLLEKEGADLAARVPFKVHFGEQGNRSYLGPETYDPLIDFLQKKGRICFFTETSVLYGGKRFNSENHTKLALSHGFTRIPVQIADGHRGEDLVPVPVPGKHFQQVSIARGLAEAEQVLVCSHFKGHALAGFGGALKQLSMGFAAKGGKLAMHMSVKPQIRNWRCRKCGLCLSRCNTGAISLGEVSRIDQTKCIGCGACFSICSHHAVSIWSLAGLRNAIFGRRIFREKLAEYAYGASHGKKHIYLNFAVNITRGCDCEPRPMHRCIPDIGVFASLDPVAVDAACLDAAAKAGRHFKGADILAYSEKIGTGSRNYEIITL